MTDYFLRAMLRGATRDRILTGWQGPHVTERSYTLAPRNGDAREVSFREVVEYVQMLQAAGVKPLFRESEPEPLP